MKTEDTDCHDCQTAADLKQSMLTAFMHWHLYLGLSLAQCPCYRRMPAKQDNADKIIMAPVQVTLVWGEVTTRPRVNSGRPLRGSVPSRALGRLTSSPNGGAELHYKQPKVGKGSTEE